MSGVPYFSADRDDCAYYMRYIYVILSKQTNKIYIISKENNVFKINKSYYIGLKRNAIFAFSFF